MASVRKLSQTPLNDTKAAALENKQISGGSSCLPVYLVCTFMDGGVGLYDLELRSWCYLREKVGPLCKHITCSFLLHCFC